MALVRITPYIHTPLGMPLSGSQCGSHKAFSPCYGFFYYHGIAFHKVLQFIKNIIWTFYIACIKQFMRKWPDLWKDKLWKLNYVNAVTYPSLLVQGFLVKTNTVVIPQPLYLGWFFALAMTEKVNVSWPLNTLKKTHWANSVIWLCH